MFRHHDLVRLRQLYEERRPLRQAGGTMQVDERWPLAVPPHAHADVADLVPVLVHALLMPAILNSVGWAKARERRAFNACCICDRAVPTRAVLHKKDRVGMARIARIILLMLGALRALPTLRRFIQLTPSHPNLLAWSRASSPHLWCKIQRGKCHAGSRTAGGPVPRRELCAGRGPGLCPGQADR